MLIIVCGEDSPSARNYYLDLKNTLAKKGYQAADMPAENIDEINMEANSTVDLFGQKKAYFTENLNRRVTVNNKNIFTDINNLKDVYVIDWESGKPAFELKIAKLGTVKEFKPDSTIFKLQENLYPGNRRIFINYLRSLGKSAESQFIFLMLVRHIRLLILAKSGNLPTRIPSWQAGKLSRQASLWDKDNLVKLYEGMFRIELSQKSGQLPYGITDALDILACYFI